jgi:hypothetical protein
MNLLEDNIKIIKVVMIAESVLPSYLTKHVDQIAWLSYLRVAINGNNSEYINTNRCATARVTCLYQGMVNSNTYRPTKYLYSHINMNVMQIPVCGL